MSSKKSSSESYSQEEYINLPKISRYQPRKSSTRSSQTTSSTKTKSTSQSTSSTKTKSTSQSNQDDITNLSNEGTSNQSSKNSTPSTQTSSQKKLEKKLNEIKFSSDSNQGENTNLSNEGTSNQSSENSTPSTQITTQDASQGENTHLSNGENFSISQSSQGENKYSFTGENYSTEFPISLDKCCPQSGQDEITNSSSQSNANQRRCIYEQTPIQPCICNGTCTLSTDSSVLQNCEYASQSRKETVVLRHETDIKTDWDNLNVSLLITDRISEVQQWTNYLKEIMCKVDHEISLMKTEQKSIEKSLTSVCDFHSSIQECVNSRSREACPPNSKQDEGANDLNNQIGVIQRARNIYSNQLQEIAAKIDQLIELQRTLQCEVCLKNNAMQVDIDQLKVDTDNPSLVRSDTTSVPMNAHTYQCWANHTKEIKCKAEQQLDSVISWRETLFHEREKARTALRSQMEMTEFTFRQKLFANQRLKCELEHQLNKTCSESAKQCKVIQDLQISISEVLKFLMVAETRLSNRNQRPGIELCNDYVQEALSNEVSNLRKSIACLECNMKQTQTISKNLQEQCRVIRCKLVQNQTVTTEDTRVLNLLKCIKSNFSI